jgi:hypothetical protein
MMTTDRETLYAEVDRATAETLRTIADQQGQSLADLVATVLESFVQSTHAEARPQVLAAYQQSHERFASLYQRIGHAN